MIALIAPGLVIAGVLILVAALLPVRRLIGHLPPGAVRSRWYLMVALIALFILGYLGYVTVFWESHAEPADLIVPVVFFCGACFVLLATTISLQTAVDVMRISLLERDVATDALTGVFNRRYLDRRLREEFASARRYGKPLSVLMIDVDHFKRINDGHGHGAGDRVLVDLATRITGELRETDILTRYGGEEFLVVAPETPLLGAINLAERVRRRIESEAFSLPGQPDGTPGIPVTVSIGLASIEDVPGSREALVQAADENLLRAKRAGRNRVVADGQGPSGPAVP